MIQTPTTHTGHYGRLPLAELMLHILLIAYWLKRHYRKICLAIVAVLLTVIILQLAYPKGRLLPFARLNGSSASFADQHSIEQLLKSQQTKPIQIIASTKQYQASLQNIGVDLTVKQSATDYPLTARLIPFSSVAYARRDLGLYVKSEIDEQRAREYFKTIIAENTRAAVEGSIRVEGTDIVLAEPQAGAQYDENQILEALKQLSLSESTSFTLPSKTTEPAYTKQALEAAVSGAKSFIGHDITITAVDKNITISRQTIASALRFVPQEAERKVAVELDANVLSAALKPLADQLYIAPVAAQVTTLDGVEISRVPGAAGRALSSQAVAALTGAIQQNQTNVVIAAESVAPANKLNRTYSKTSHGLQVLINDWAAESWATRWSVVVKELGGSGRTALIKPDDQYVVASVYKMFLAYPTLTAVDNGSLDLAALTSTGKTVDVCIEQMIVISSNACAHALGNLIGWNAATDAIHARGFGSTSLSFENGFYSTAADAARAAEQLYFGSYLPAAQNSRLLDMMRRQIYRNGIPAGSRGIAVANKVGYVEGYRHDVGIVYHPNGVYVLSVFSLNGTYPSIANLATRLNAYFNN